MPRIDPSLPCLWRSPDSLQIGADPARARVDSVSSADERLISALLRGVSDSALTDLAFRLGLSPLRFTELRNSLAPTFLAETSPARLRIVVERSTPDDAPVPSIAYADRVLARHLAALGHEVIGRHHPGRPDLAIVTAAHLVSPGTAQYWLSRDVLHLPVVTSDQAVTIGPLVVPGLSACLHCAFLTRVDRDPAWPAVAAQLISPELSRLTVDAPQLALEAAVFVGRLVDRLSPEREAEAAGIAGLSHRLEPSGEVSETSWPQDPRCGCRQLAAATRSRTVTAAASTIGAGRHSPTTVAAPPEHA